jgi:hypothetical protein
MRFRNVRTGAVQTAVPGSKRATIFQRSQQWKADEGSVTQKELQEKAKASGVKGYSGMNKAQLLEALAKAQEDHGEADSE